MSTIRPFASHSKSIECLSTDCLRREDICGYETCSMQKYAHCAHCNHRFCFGHLLSHHEQLSTNTHRHRLAIDQLEEQIQGVKLDGVLHRSIDSLDRWRSNLIQNIERIYQEKLNMIKTKHSQLNAHLQRYQFEQFSQIQAIRLDLERNKTIRNTYDQEMFEIKTAITHLQKTFMDVQCDLIMKEYPTYNIENSIDCELVWTHSTSAFAPVISRSTSEVRPMEMTPPNSTTKSPKDEEETIRFFLIDSDDEGETRTRSKSFTRSSNSSLTKTPPEELSPIIVVNSDKKYKIKKLCKNCGHYFHPCSLNRHVRQCIQTSPKK